MPGWIVCGKLGNLVLQGADALQEIGELGDQFENTAAVGGGRCGRPHQDRLVRDIADDAGLGGDRHIVAEIEVADDTGLAADGDVMADSRAAGNTDLGDDHAVGADGDAVADGDHVTQFCPSTDRGPAQGGALNSSVGADLDIIFEDDDSDLGNLVMLAFVGGVAKAVVPDDSAGVKDDAIAKKAIIVDDGVGIKDAIAADAGAGADIDAGIDDRAGTDDGSRVDMGLRMDAGVGVRSMAVEQDDGLHERVVGVAGAEKGDAIVFYIQSGNDRGGASGGEKLFVFGIGEEADLAGAGFFKRVNGRDDPPTVADDLGADLFSELRNG